MNANWLYLILILLVLGVVPRFILELAWARRVRLRARERGVTRLSLMDRLKAQSVLLLASIVVGVILAVAALIVVLVRG